MKRKAIKILLVEDNPDHVLLTKVALEEDGVIKNDIYVAKDGQEALDFVYNQGKYSDAPRPGLIILDVKLPKVNGFEVLRQLKKDPTFKSIPIVMLTTSAEREDVARGYAEGANSFVTKPTKFNEFVSKIKSIPSYWFTTSTLPLS